MCDRKQNHIGQTVFNRAKMLKIEARLEALEAESAANRALWLCISTSLSAEERSVLAIAISAIQETWDLNNDVPERHKVAFRRLTRILAEGVDLADRGGLE